MKNSLVIFFTLFAFICTGQTSNSANEETLIRKVLIDPSVQEISEVLSGLRKQDLTPREVVIHDCILLSNSSELYILSHKVEGRIHYGAVIVPQNNNRKRLPIIVFATGGDGMHKEFDIGKDFNHPAVHFPSFFG